ncbi:MAG: hypothetical protein RLY35_1971 [Bacteroidota bacterium]|jgi:polysaccharide export outer membrane protein
MNVSGLNWVVFRVLFFFISTAIFFSCSSPKDVIYLQTGVIPSGVNPRNALKCQIGDELSVRVYSINHEVVAPFNTFLKEGENETSPTKGYLVSESSELTLPLIGSVKAVGLTLDQLQDTIGQRLLGFVKSPIVSVQMLNFRVTVLGDVAKPGVIKVANGHINVLEAIGSCGDMNITGLRSDVMVVRNMDGVQKEFHLDLTDKATFSKEGFQLQQNDIVYVKPNLTKRRDAQISSVRTTMLISLTSLILSTIILIFIK